MYKKILMILESLCKVLWNCWELVLAIFSVFSIYQEYIMVIVQEKIILVLQYAFSR